MRKVLSVLLVAAPFAAFAQSGVSSAGSRTVVHEEPKKEAVVTSDFLKNVVVSGAKLEIHVKRFESMTEADRNFIMSNPDSFAIIGREENEKGGAK